MKINPSKMKLNKNAENNIKTIFIIIFSFFKVFICNRYNIIMYPYNDKSDILVSFKYD